MRASTNIMPLKRRKARKFVLRFTALMSTNLSTVAITRNMINTRLMMIGVANCDLKNTLRDEVQWSIEDNLELFSPRKFEKSEILRVLQGKLGCFDLGGKLIPKLQIHFALKVLVTLRDYIITKYLEKSCLHNCLFNCTNTFATRSVVIKKTINK